MSLEEGKGLSDEAASHWGGSEGTAEWGDLWNCPREARLGTELSE